MQALTYVYELLVTTTAIYLNITLVVVRTTATATGAVVQHVTLGAIIFTAVLCGVCAVGVRCLREGLGAALANTTNGTTTAT